MEHIMEEMQKDIHDLKNLVQKLYTIIAGHELDKESGVINQVKDHETRIKRIEAFRDRMVWMGIGVSIPAGLGIVEIIKLVLIAFK